MASIQELKERLDRAGEIENPLEKRAMALAILTESLPGYGIRLSAIRTGVVALYILQEQPTDEVDSVMADLGFIKVGRHWVRGELDILVEAPPSVPRDVAGVQTDDRERERLLIELDMARRQRWIASGKLEILGPRLWKWRVDFNDGDSQ